VVDAFERENDSFKSFFANNNNNNNNNKQICIAQLGRSFRGARSRQRVNEHKKDRKPGWK